MDSPVNTIPDSPPNASAPPAGTTERHRILNTTRGTELAVAAVIADTPAKRSRGLLGRAGLQPGEALWIVPCEAVHTFWMRFSLDLVYLDRRCRIVKVKRNVPPWRLSGCLRAHSVIEFAAGQIGDECALPGDQLMIQPLGQTLDQTQDRTLERTGELR